MSEIYPYIQTLHGFDKSIDDYAIQPVGDEGTTAPPEENPILAFGPLGRINIFVGANNSGKSRFLRQLAKSKRTVFFPDQKTEIASNQFIEAGMFLAQTDGSICLSFTTEGLRRQFAASAEWAELILRPFDAEQRQHDWKFDTELFKSIEPENREFVGSRLENYMGGRKVFSYILEPNEKPYHYMLAVRDLLRKLLEDCPYSSTSLNDVQGVSFQLTFSGSKEYQQKFVQFADAVELLHNLPEMKFSDFHRIYLPVLRSAVTLFDGEGKLLKGDVFGQTVRKNYNMEGLEVFTGNVLYDLLAEDKRSSKAIRDQLRSLEQLLGEKFFDGQQLELVASSEPGGEHVTPRITVSIGGGADRHLHDLGDGINMLLILLYRVFTAGANSWIFIEEPELNLHPGLQRVFLQTLLENEVLQKRDLRVFFTTHSNHLLRMTLRACLKSS